LVFTAADKQTARQLAKTLIRNYEEKAAKAMDCLENGLDPSLSIFRKNVEKTSKYSIIKNITN